jgi:hypothetical protein
MKNACEFDSIQYYDSADECRIHIYTDQKKTLKFRRTQKLLILAAVPLEFTEKQVKSAFGGFSYWKVNILFAQH